MGREPGAGATHAGGGPVPLSSAAQLTGLYCSSQEPPVGVILVPKTQKAEWTVPTAGIVSNATVASLPMTSP